MRFMSGLSDGPSSKQIDVRLVPVAFIVLVGLFLVFELSVVSSGTE